MRIRLGVDTGGTFTDFVQFGPDGLAVHKVRSTPDDPSRAILAGLAEISAGHALRGPGSEAPRPDIVHGSTVATNAVLERKGARVALVTTRGFEDVLRIGRQTRPQLYNIFVPAPKPLVNPALTFGVTERLDASGRIVVPIVDDEIETLAGHLRQWGVEISAVCLLHSYANPAHEQRVARALSKHGLIVCASHEVLPEYREFERWSTTVVNAYVTPLIDRYLGRLEAAAPDARLSIMQSNGGSISAGAARTQAVRTILSGPAAGVVGARAVARAAGLSRVVSFDMGGTSTDVSLIDGAIATTTDFRIGDFPVRLPVIDIETVGAGGGSIAFVDTGGALRVGPRSAGADPGPVCYGSGVELTVTDANLILGRLDPDLFFDGRMTIEVDRTHRIAADMARRLGVRVHELAEGIVRVANANMERAIRVVSVERGHDPRAFSLLAFGGAGGMHACEIAERLDMRSVVVPRHGGVLSALGMLLAEVAKDYSAAVLRRTDSIRLSELTRRFIPLVRHARDELKAEGFGPSAQRVQRALDVRYVGQSYELTVPFARDFRRVFDREHHRRYGYADVARPTEIVNIRVAAFGVADKPTLPVTRPRRRVDPRPDSVRQGRFAGRMTKVAFHRWPTLVPGSRSRGPAVITSGEATVVIPPGWRFQVDRFGNVVADRPQASGRGPQRRSFRPLRPGA
jgi:N-methylhydantoinase A/oxoprolinase/acetone carboxylase beta subunit